MIAGYSNIANSSMNYGSSSQSYGSAGSSIPDSLMGSSSSFASNESSYMPANSSSIDDLLPYQNMRPETILNNGFYPKPEHGVYVPGQQGDFGLGDFTRVQMGYGVNSKTEMQYGFKK